MHLDYSIMGAHLNCGETRHAQEVMKSLGITYQFAVPQSLFDSWWFWNCENVPDKLPSYLTVLDLDPMQCIGNGLSHAQATMIRDAMPKQPAKVQKRFSIRWIVHNAILFEQSYDEFFEKYEKKYNLGIMADKYYITLTADIKDFALAEPEKEKPAEEDLNKRIIDLELKLELTRSALADIALSDDLARDNARGARHKAKRIYDETGEH